jgi:hypothetical protein
MLIQLYVSLHQGELNTIIFLDDYQQKFISGLFAGTLVDALTNIVKLQLLCRLLIMAMQVRFLLLFATPLIWSKLDSKQHV